MDKLALNLPQFGNVPNTGVHIEPGYGVQSPTLTGLIGGFLNLAFAVALIIVFIYFAWGAFEYIVAEGQKEALGKARERIRWALVGFMLLVLAFLVGNWAPSIFPFVRRFYDMNQVPKIQDTGTQQIGNPNDQNYKCGDSAYWEPKENKCVSF